MAFTYQLSELSKLGEFDEKYGQRYWGAIMDDLTPVSFNSKNQNISAGDTIECEEKAQKQSKKGTIYWQLKKVQVNSTSLGEKPATASQNASGSDIKAQLDRIEAMVKELLGIGVDKKLDAEIELPIEPLITDVDEEVDLDGIPF
jgi:hypothetical protein